MKHQPHMQLSCKSTLSLGYQKITFVCVVILGRFLVILIFFSKYLQLVLPNILNILLCDRQTSLTFVHVKLFELAQSCVDFIMNSSQASSLSHGVLRADYKPKKLSVFEELPIEVGPSQAFVLMLVYLNLFQH